MTLYDSLCNGIVRHIEIQQELSILFDIKEFVVATCPQQKDGYNCGFHVSYFAKMLITGDTSQWSFDPLEIT